MVLIGMVCTYVLIRFQLHLFKRFNCLTCVLFGGFLRPLYSLWKWVSIERVVFIIDLILKWSIVQLLMGVAKSLLNLWVNSNWTETNVNN